MTATVGRWIRLQGAVNVRDVGGLPLVGGGTTTSGRLLRADNLQDLTASDVRSLVDELGVRVVLDLRTELEARLEGPGPLRSEPEVRHEHLSLLPAMGQTTDLAADAVLPWTRDERHSLHRRGDADAVSRLYGQYLRDRPDSILRALRAITELPVGAALVHCAAGKDRTGVVVALALSAAGVQREAIVVDYTASGEVIDAIVARLVASPTYAADISARPPDSHRPRAESIRRFLADLDEQFGGPAGWLGEQGFTADEQRQLRVRLVS